MKLVYQFWPRGVRGDLRHTSISAEIPWSYFGKADFYTMKRDVLISSEGRFDASDNGIIRENKPRI